MNSNTVSVYGNYTNQIGHIDGSGYTTPEHNELNQHLNPIPTLPTLYHNPTMYYSHPSPPLSDDMSTSSPTYAVSPLTPYTPTLQYAQQAPVSYSRGPVVSGGRRRSSPDVLPNSEHAVQTRYKQSISMPSRKDAPSSHPYPRRHPRSQLQISDDDEEDLAELSPNATDQQKLEYQRHRNTLAARRSRKRKELYKQELEQKVEYLTMETEKWRTRAEMLERIIEGQGLGIYTSQWCE